MLKTALAAFSMILVGCASTPTPQWVEQGRLVPPAGKGIAVIALTGQSFNDQSAQLTLHLDGPAGKTSEQVSLGTEMLSPPSDPNYLNTRRLSISFRPLGIQVGNSQNVRGRVLVMPLVAGDYKVSNVTGSWLREGVQSSDLETLNLPIDKPFQLAAGEVVYLGDIHVNMNFRSNVVLGQNPERDFFNLETRRGVTDFSNILMRPLQADPVQ